MWWTNSRTHGYGRISRGWVNFACLHKVFCFASLFQSDKQVLVLRRVGQGLRCFLVCLAETFLPSLDDSKIVDKRRRQKTRSCVISLSQPYIATTTKRKKKVIKQLRLQEKMYHSFFSIKTLILKTGECPGQWQGSSMNNEPYVIKGW